ncbi:hypothetical protein ACWC9T_10605 [Kitasatospora sp. NPDC001159]
MVAAVAVVVVVVPAVDAVGGGEGEDSLVAVEGLHHEDRVLPEKAMNLELVLVAGLGGIIHVHIR